MNCQKKRILIIEDDPTFSLLLETWCQKNNYDSVAVFTIKAAQEEVYNNTFDLILSDLRLPDSDGIMFLTWLKDQKNEVPVIILTNYADIRTAVSAMKLGAFDFMEKPVNHLIMSEKVKMAMEEKKDKEKSGKHKVATIGFDESINYSDESNVNKRRKTKSRKQDIGTGEKDVAVDMVIGNSTVAEEMFAHIRLVAPTELSVLITGASGTGKEHVAKTIHTLSKRNKAPFVAVDCGALSKELSASEFFGHLKGSFTSAISDKTGVFEEANGGTLFFDEVGNLHYDVQVQLLRTLQERKIRKVGSSKEIAVDVRLICATNEDLTKAIQEGRFREDLYHRLQEFMINVPTLHNRIEDIELFSNFFREQANHEISKSVDAISPEVLAILKQHHWKGNLRELKNTIRRAVLFATGNTILPEHLPIFQEIPHPSLSVLFDEKDEKQRIIVALHTSGGNKTIAARKLNIDRKTLYNKIHAYNIDLG